MYAWCVLSISTAACGPQSSVTPELWSTDTREPVEIAIDLYESAHEEMAPGCVQRAYVTEFVEMDSDALAVECGTEKHAAGACYMENDSTPRVAIDHDDADSKRLRAHELMHVILDCQSGSAHDGDGMHEDAVWKVLDPDAVGWTAQRRDWR